MLEIYGVIIVEFLFLKQKQKKIPLADFFLFLCLWMAYTACSSNQECYWVVFLGTKLALGGQVFHIYIYTHIYEWCCPQTQEITHRESIVFIMLNYYFLDFLIFCLTIEVIGEVWNLCVYWQVPRRLRKHFKSLKLGMKSVEGVGFLKLIYSIIKSQDTMEICWGSVTGLC